MVAGWKRNDVKPTRPPIPLRATARKVYLVHRPNSVQTTVALGNIAIDRRSPDYIPMVVMNDVIGGGVSARLFFNLREEKGYTYGVYSDFSASRYPGPWRAGGNMRTEVTEGALVEFFKEIDAFRDETVPPAELEDSKRSIAASFALSLEQPTRDPRACRFARTVYGLPDDYWDTYPPKSWQSPRRMCNGWRASISTPTRCSWSRWATAKDSICVGTIWPGGSLR